MNDIIGTWRLVATPAHDEAGQPMPAFYGPQPKGLVAFDPDGRMMAVLCDGRPSLPDDAPRAYSSYCGNYRYDGDTLVTRVDATADASRFSDDQVRRVRFEEGRLVLVPPPRPFNGRMMHMELVWERLA